MSDNINGITPGENLLGDFQDAPIDNQQGNNNQQAADDPILAEINSVFGTMIPGEDSSDGADNNGMRNRRSSSKQETILENVDPFNPSAKNTPKDPEALLRKLQSERDSTKAELEKFQKEITRYKTYEDFLGQLQEDAEVRHAFIAELEPELVKPKDPLTFVQEGLKKEFGNDFSPTAEGAEPLKVQLYNERARELYTEWKDKQKAMPNNLKDLAARRKQARERAALEAQAEKQKIMSDMKWDENTFGEFSKWVTQIKGTHMAQIWNHVKGQAKQTRAPFATNQPGGNSYMPSNLQVQLDTMFGN